MHLNSYFIPIINTISFLVNRTHFVLLTEIKFVVHLLYCFYLVATMVAAPLPILWKMAAVPFPAPASLVNGDRWPEGQIHSKMATAPLPASRRWPPPTSGVWFTNKGDRCDVYCTSLPLLLEMGLVVHVPRPVIQCILCPLSQVWSSEDGSPSLPWFHD